MLRYNTVLLTLPLLTRQDHAIVRELTDLSLKLSQLLFLLLQDGWLLLVQVGVLLVITLVVFVVNSGNRHHWVTGDLLWHVCRKRRRRRDLRSRHGRHLLDSRRLLLLLLLVLLLLLCHLRLRLISVSLKIVLRMCGRHRRVIRRDL